MERRELLSARVAALARKLEEARAEAALVLDPRHVVYFFGHPASTTAPAVGVVTSGGASTLAIPAGAAAEDAVADRVICYASSFLSTLREDTQGLALEAVLPALGGRRRVLADSSHAPRLPCLDGSENVAGVIRELRRAKYADELERIQRAIGAAESGYAAAARVIAPGVSELEVFAHFHRAAVLSLEEPIGELGNDFRGGAPGGSPRAVALRRGELLPLDAGVAYRRYHSDLCRTFAVGGAWTGAQRAAADRVEEVLAMAEQLIRPGSSCRELYEVTKRELDGYHGWRFPHHLGHGVGLDPHEAPHINPEWDDRFEVGDVFTLEPGLYGEELRAGVRLEHMYHLTETGLRRLSGQPAGPAVPVEGVTP